MPVDPAMPPSLAAELRDLRERISKLERLPKLPFSSTKGGSLTLLDEDGNVRWVAGNVTLNNIDGSKAPGYGVFNTDAQGEFLSGQSSAFRGWLYPIEQLAMHDPTAKTVTSAGFVDLFETQMDNPSREVVQIEGAINTDAGTTAQIRLRDGVSGNVTGTITVPAGSNGFYQFYWLHPATCGLGDKRAQTEGRAPTIFLILEALRVSGSGNVRVFPPVVAQLSSRWLVPEADTNGNPTFLS